MVWQRPAQCKMSPRTKPFLMLKLCWTDQCYLLSCSQCFNCMCHKMPFQGVQTTKAEGRGSGSNWMIQSQSCVSQNASCVEMVCFGSELMVYRDVQCVEFFFSFFFFLSILWALSICHLQAAVVREAMNVLNTVTINHVVCRFIIPLHTSTFIIIGKAQYSLNSDRRTSPSDSVCLGGVGGGGAQPWFCFNLGKITPIPSNGSCIEVNL